MARGRGPGGSTGTGRGTGSVLALGGALVGFLVCFVGAATAAADLGRPHDAPTWLLTTIAGALVVGAAVLVRVAVHVEHQLRSTPGSGAPPPAPRRPPKDGPVARAIAVLAAIGAVVLVVVATVQGHAGASRSAATQDHGLRRTGTISDVRPVHHATKYDSWTTYDYTVLLERPGDQRASTTLHDPARDVQAYSEGQPVQVLVDPEDRGYAELPGERVQGSTWFVGPLVLGACVAGLGTLLVVEQVRHHRHRRATATPT